MNLSPNEIMLILELNHLDNEQVRFDSIAAIHDDYADWMAEIEAKNAISRFCPSAQFPLVDWKFL